MKKTVGKMVNGVLQGAFAQPYFTCDTFKQKEIAYLNRVIGECFKDYLTFNGYATISFNEDDAQHNYPVVTTVNGDGKPLEWSRKGTNCLVYDFHRTGKNDMYDKLYLYHTCYRNGTGIWYGWLLWDKNTGRMTHKYCISHDSTDLLQAISYMIQNIPGVKRIDKALAESRRKSKKK